MNPAKHVADAAIKAAKANHYLVGLVGAHGSKLRIDFDTAEDARQLIYTMENSGKITEKTASIALHLITEAYSTR